MKSFSILVILIFSQLLNSYGQTNSSVDEQAAYLKVITKRADKIVAALKLSDSLKSEKVSKIVRTQYSDLNDIYALRDEKIKAIKLKYAEDKVSQETALKEESLSVEKALAKLHKKYLAKLSSKLKDEQVDQVKNEMTYNVLPITYRAYQEEILTLTDDQKKQILVWLTEAREHAIDAESADKKHAWFGKYKGRINNFLSAAGYDLKKEGVEWEKRRKSTAQTN